MSYGRTSLVAVLSVLATGTTDPKLLAHAFLISIIGPLIRWLNPNDKSFGIGANND